MINNPKLVLGQLLKIKPIEVDISESLADAPVSGIDLAMIDYVVADLEKNGKNSQYHKMFNMYKNTTDVNLRDKLSYMMMASPQHAKNMLRSFLQKEVRNGVYTMDDYSGGADEGGGSELIDFTSMYDITDDGVDSSIGLFAGQEAYAREADPAGVVEIQDFLTKFFNNKKLSVPTRYVILARLLTGETAGTGKSKNSGIALNEIVDDLPPEYDTIINQYHRFLDAGWTAGEITARLILLGYEGTDETGNKLSISALTNNNRIKRASDNAWEVFKDLTGVEIGTKNEGKDWDLQQIGNWLIGSAVNEALESSDINEAGKNKNKMAKMLRVFSAFVGAGKFKAPRADIISSLVFAISSLMKNKSKSKLAKSWGKKSTLAIARGYLKKAKSSKIQDQIAVYGLVMELVSSQDSKFAKLTSDARKRLDKVKVR